MTNKFFSHGVDILPDCLNTLMFSLHMHYKVITLEFALAKSLWYLSANAAHQSAVLCDSLLATQWNVASPAASAAPAVHVCLFTLFTCGTVHVSPCVCVCVCVHLCAPTVHSCLDWPLQDNDFLPINECIHFGGASWSIVRVPGSCDCETLSKSKCLKVTPCWENFWKKKKKNWASQSAQTKPRINRSLCWDQQSFCRTKRVHDCTSSR